MILRGVNQMVRKIKAVASKFPDRVATALYQEAQIEATEMKRRTPVDTRDNAPHPGNLRNSIHVEDPERGRGRRISVTIATGKQAPYAIFVHENPDAFHPVGQWKFMESVLNESQPHMAQRVARRIHLDRIA
jgi:hypothetical protein